MWEPGTDDQELNMARENDWIYNRDGTKCHSDLFCSVIDKINLALQQAVIQYQIIQKDYNEFDVLIAAEDNEGGITGINPNAEIYSIRVLDDASKL